MQRFFRFFLPLVTLAPALLAEPPPPAASGQLTFLRCQDEGKVASLETLSEELKSADGKGPSIWLIGVAHIGTPEYYAALQKKLDAQTTVLYEGVGEEKFKDGVKPDTKNGVQGKLADALGLVFQLDAIEYQRPNFVSCDLTMAGLEKAIADQSSKSAGLESKSDSREKPGSADPSAAEEKSRGSKLPKKVDNGTFNILMQAIRGEGDFAPKLNGMIAAMGSTPEMRETVKLTLVETFGQARDLINMAKSVSPDIRDMFEVILNERNENVIRQIKARLPKLRPDQTIAVFYGAAHMDQIAERLTKDLHYTPGAQAWDTAFTADPAKSMMPPAQIKALVQMMRTQLQNVKPGQGGGLQRLLSMPGLQGDGEKTVTPGK